MQAPNKSAARERRKKILGSHALLGLDVVAFSKLDNDSQGEVIGQTLDWIRRALSFHNVLEGDYRWSPAGDGGYLTFDSPRACTKAIDMALSLCQFIVDPQENKSNIRMRFAVHAGGVVEADELGRTSNIWGEGINTTARILSVSSASQILVSEQYFDQYVRGKREDYITCTNPHYRTVKHGVQVQVRNANHGQLGMSAQEAQAKQWASIGGLCRKMITEYEFLVEDAMRSGSAVAALAASKFLLDMEPTSVVAANLMETVSQFGSRPQVRYERQTHEILSLLPPPALTQLLRQSTARTFLPNAIICRDGDVARSCYFIVSGNVEVDIPVTPKPVVGHGTMLGEFGLWIANSPRTATLQARDECVILEVPFQTFQSICASYPGVEETVAALIKYRLLTNVVNSKQFFPDLTSADHGRLTQAPSTCAKHRAGDILDLRSHTFILFAGSLRLFPRSKGGASLDVVAPGRNGGEHIAGIITLDEPFSLDGDKAEVLTDSVLVRISHDVLLGVQSGNDSIASKWHEIQGRRLGEVNKKIKALPAKDKPDVTALPTPILAPSVSPWQN